jgi:uncharacterized protein YecE (DUF72 family)
MTGYFVSDEQMGYLKSFIKDLSDDAYTILLRIEDKQSNNSEAKDTEIAKLKRIIHGIVNDDDWSVGFNEQEKEIANLKSQRDNYQSFADIHLETIKIKDKEIASCYENLRRVQEDLRISCQEIVEMKESIRKRIEEVKVEFKDTPNTRDAIIWELNHLM